jgi:inositol phosphorylceramide mannosyltransferase catalytic subunit
MSSEPAEFREDGPARRRGLVSKYVSVEDEESGVASELPGVEKDDRIWLEREAELNSAATKRGFLALLLCLALGFFPAVSLTLTVAATWGLESIGLNPIPLRHLTPESDSSLRTLRMQAVQFVLKHPGVKRFNIHNGFPAPKAGAPPQHGRTGQGFRANQQGSTASASAEPKHFGVFDGSEYAPLGVADLDSHALIPRLVHQTWKDHNVPLNWQPSHQAWLASYGEEYPLTLLLWSDQALHDFVHELFPWFASQYDAYRSNIQRVDVARYFILYALGGIYSDLDITFREHKVWSQQVLRSEFMFPETAPLGVSNDLIASMPGHPFFALLCERLMSGAVSAGWMYTNFFTVMFSTGPSFVSTQLQSYRLQRRAAGLPAEVVHQAVTLDKSPGIFILPTVRYNAGPESIVGHVAGASWHQGDSGVLWWLFVNLPEGYALAGVILIPTVVIATMIVMVIMSIGWLPQCQRREARALLCCIYRSFRFETCCGSSRRPYLCPCVGVPVMNPYDNPTK